MSEDLITVYVSIGNSDDKLTQASWSEFVLDAIATVRRYASQVFGEWYSASDSRWQNACIAAAVSVGYVDALRGQLTVLREGFGQDSVAWAVVTETEFI